MRRLISVFDKIFVIIIHLGLYKLLLGLICKCFWPIDFSEWWCCTFSDINLSFVLYIVIFVLHHIIIYFYCLFFNRRPLTSCFISCRPFVVNATFSTGLVVYSVSWLGQLSVGVKKSLIISIVGFRNFFVVWSGLLLLDFKSLMRGEVCTLGHFVLRLSIKQTSPLISDLNSKINSPDQTTKKFRNPTIEIISHLSFNCQLPKPGDRRNYKTSWKCREAYRKENTTSEWDDGGK